MCARSRKFITKADLDNNVAIFAFDLLYYNDEPLIFKTLKERRQLLREVFKEIPGKFYFASSMDFKPLGVNEDANHTD